MARVLSTYEEEMLQHVHASHGTKASIRSLWQQTKEAPIRPHWLATLFQLILFPLMICILCLGLGNPNSWQKMIHAVIWVSWAAIVFFVLVFLRNRNYLDRMVAHHRLLDFTAISTYVEWNWLEKVYKVVCASALSLLLWRSGYGWTGLLFLFTWGACFISNFLVRQKVQVVLDWGGWEVVHAEDALHREPRQAN